MNLKKIISNESGMTAIFTVVLISVFIVICGLVIDSSMMIYKQVQLDAATDAAALSVSEACDGEKYETEGIIDIDEDLAKDFITFYLVENMKGAKLLEFQSKTVENDEGTLETTAIVRTSYIYKPHFKKILGASDQTITSEIIVKLFSE